MASSVGVDCSSRGGLSIRHLNNAARALECLFGDWFVVGRRVLGTCRLELRAPGGNSFEVASRGRFRAKPGLVESPDAEVLATGIGRGFIFSPLVGNPAFT